MAKTSSCRICTVCRTKDARTNATNCDNAIQEARNIPSRDSPLARPCDSGRGRASASQVLCPIRRHWLLGPAGDWRDASGRCSRGRGSALTRRLEIATGPLTAMVDPPPPLASLYSRLSRRLQRMTERFHFVAGGARTGGRRGEEEGERRGGGRREEEETRRKDAEDDAQHARLFRRI
ncbi:hypothetical protein J3E68DRAFT_434876 [Trichoderma sp. SZMC 28012]